MSYIKPASGTTILGISTFIGLTAYLILSATLRHFGYSAEAAIALGAAWACVHPQVNRAIGVSPEPPNEPLPEARE